MIILLISLLVIIQNLLVGDMMFKEYFPYFSNSEIVYLDNAATTQKPKVVIDEIVDYYTNYCSNTHRSNHGNANKATQKFEHTREILKKLINAKDKSEIIFTKGVTESINFIASSYVKKRFSTVIISSLEHHSNIVPWQMLGKSLNRGLKVVKCNKNLDFDFDDFEEIFKIIFLKPGPLIFYLKNKIVKTNHKFIEM